MDCSLHASVTYYTLYYKWDMSNNPQNQRFLPFSISFSLQDSPFLGQTNLSPFSISLRMFILKLNESPNNYFIKNVRTNLLILWLSDHGITYNILVSKKFIKHRFLGSSPLWIELITHRLLILRLCLLVLPLKSLLT